MELMSPYEKVIERGNGVGTGIITPENMPIMHEKLLETISYFDEFCTQHKLTYCLVSGSLLGAIRHKGFIPWDDDMDVAMPRTDYEKLFILWNEYGDHQNYSLYRTTKDFCAKVPIGLLRNKNTTVIYDFNREDDLSHGVKIDIEPWDEVPNNKLLRIIQKLHFRLFEIYATQRMPVSSPLMSNHRGLKTIVLKIMYSIVRSSQARWSIASKALKNATKYNEGNYEYVRCNASSPLCKKELLFDTRRAPFEDIELCIPNQYDTLLRNEYGDYMKKPDAANRKPCINYFFYDLYSPYDKYYGIKYCVQDDDSLPL